MNRTSTNETSKQCQNCLSNFQSKSKVHLLNNRHFCHQCREIYRNIWKKITINCQNSLKIIFQTSLSQNLSGDLPTILSPKYAKVLAEYIKKEYECGSGTLLSSAENSESFCSMSVVWHEKCKWCIFKKMTPLVCKIPVFRYSNNWNEREFWKQFFSFNLLIVEQVLELLKEPALEPSEEMEDSSTCMTHSPSVPSPATCKTRRSSINDSAIEDLPTEVDTSECLKVPNPKHLNMPMEDLNLSILQNYYNAFKQIHLDQINCCYYLEGMFENPTYLFRRFGRFIDSKELLSIESYKPKKGLYNNGNKMQEQEELDYDNIINYWTSRSNWNNNKSVSVNRFFENEENTGCMSLSCKDSNTLTDRLKRLTNFLPLKVTRHVHTFAKIMLNLTTPYKVDQELQECLSSTLGPHICYSAVEKCKEQIMTLNNASSHYKNLLRLG